MHFTEDQPGEAAFSQAQHAARKQGLSSAEDFWKNSASAESTSLIASLSEQVDGTASKPLRGEVGEDSNVGTQQPALGGSAQACDDASKAPDVHATRDQNGSVSTAQLQSALGPDSGTGSSVPLPVEASAAGADRQPQEESPVPASEHDHVCSKHRPRHYWGQALQYLEKSADVTKGVPHVLETKHSRTQVKLNPTEAVRCI